MVIANYKLGISASEDGGHTTSLSTEFCLDVLARAHICPTSLSPYPYHSGVSWPMVLSGLRFQHCIPSCAMVFTPWHAWQLGHAMLNAGHAEARKLHTTVCFSGFFRLPASLLPFRGLANAGVCRDLHTIPHQGLYPMWDILREVCTFSTTTVLYSIIMLFLSA